MSTNRKIELTQKAMFVALDDMRSCFNQKPSDKDLTVYARLLSTEFEVSQVTWALSQLVKKGAVFFPSCGEIFAMLTPLQEKKEDRAPVIANEIIQLIRSYHQDLEGEMYAQASYEARLVLDAIGNTADIRNSENFETMRAQLERYVRGVLSAKEADEKSERLESIGISDGRVLRMNKDKTNVLQLKNKEDVIDYAFKTLDPKGMNEMISNIKKDLAPPDPESPA